jgi:hypothetical protein
MLELRVRNQIWYFARLFPATVAARRIPAYLAFDLVECAYRGAIGSWLRGVTRAWRERGAIETSRLPRGTVRRAELNRGRTHMRLLSGQLRRRLAARGR